MEDKPVHTLANNVKTVNNVWVCEEENRLFTGSIDGHVKIYDLGEVIKP